MSVPARACTAFSVALPLHAARPFLSCRPVGPTHLRHLPPAHRRALHVAPPAHVPRVLRAAPMASLALSSAASVASTGAGVLVLGFIVFVHECGHFLAARAQNIRVKNFSIGFGPKIWSFTPPMSETEFTLRLLPLGGFVAFPEHMSTNENGEQVLSDDKDMLQNRPLLDRAIVISAGVVANLILAWAAIFTSMNVLGVPSYTFERGVKIEAVVDARGAAAQAGLRAGDIIVQVDGEPVAATVDNSARVAEYIRSSKGREILFGVQRDGGELDVSVRPKCCTPDGSALMGVQLNSRLVMSRDKHATLLATMKATNEEFWRLCSQTTRGLVAAVSNFEQSSKNLSGPVGVVSMGAQLAREDAAALLTFCAVISINLAVINALPLPALDGGQMVLLGVEWVRGSPVSLRVQDAINRTALLLLLAFSGVLFVGDLERLQIVAALERLFS